MVEGIGLAAAAEPASAAPRIATPAVRGFIVLLLPMTSNARMRLGEVHRGLLGLLKPPWGSGVWIVGWNLTSSMAVTPAWLSQALR